MKINGNIYVYRKQKFLKVFIYNRILKMELNITYFLIRDIIDIVHTYVCINSLALRNMNSLYLVYFFPFYKY